MSKQTEGVKMAVDSCNFDRPIVERVLPGKLAGCGLVGPVSPVAAAAPSASAAAAAAAADDKSHTNNSNGDSSSENGTRTNGAPAHFLGEASGHAGGGTAAAPTSMANILHIDEAELTRATANWSGDCILGRGGFGTVYKGYWMETHVAIKRMENVSFGCRRYFFFWGGGQHCR